MTSFLSFRGRVIVWAKVFASKALSRSHPKTSWDRIWICVLSTMRPGLARKQLVRFLFQSGAHVIKTAIRS